jgi:hypothetical protein
VSVGVGPCRRLFSASIVLLVCAGAAVSSTPRPTVPPSSYQSGLGSVPNPLNSSGNLAITGNVAAGKHFRGNIPYNSTTSFGAPLGSTSLDSFLRYSAGPNVQTSYPQNYTPYYSSTGTVTSTQPGYQGVFSPVSPRIAGSQGQVRSDPSLSTMTMFEAPEPQLSTGERNASDSLGVETSPRFLHLPTSTNFGVMQDGVSISPGDLLAQRPLSPTGDPLLTSQEYQQRLDLLRQNVERIQADLSQFQQNRDVDGSTTPPQSPLQPLPPAPRQESMSRPDETLTENLQTLSPPEARLELYDSTAGHEMPGSLPPAERGQTDSSSAGPDQFETVEPGKLPAVQRIEEASRLLPRSTKDQSPGASPAAGRLRNPAGNERPAQEIAEPNPAQTPSDASKQSPTEARRTYETSGSATQKQFDEYLAAARSHMQRGRYDHAATSFTLAGVYISHDPRPHFGKSLALLASGEYAGSALSLARAIELDARYALRKVDLVETLGGPDLFVQRISKLEEDALAGNAPQLQLLLAYVYFQMRQDSEAGSAIEAVRKTMPSSIAAGLLEAAIRGTAG